MVARYRLCDVKASVLVGGVCDVCGNVLSRAVKSLTYVRDLYGVGLARDVVIAVNYLSDSTFGAARDAAQVYVLSRLDLTVITLFV